MRHKFVLYFMGAIFIVPIFTLILVNGNGDINQSDWTIVDDNLEVLVEVNGRNIREAVEKDKSILIDPNGYANASLRFSVVSNYPIKLERLKIVFIWAGFDTFSQTQVLDVTLYPEDNSLYVIQMLKFKDYFGQDIQFISGIYELRYDLSYMVEGHQKEIKGIPFYVMLSGNPVTTVTGVATTVSVAYSGISMLGLVYSIRKSIQLEIDKSIESTQVSPTKKLMGYYTGLAYKNIQNEISNVVFGYSTKLWSGDSCPQCGTKWLEGQKECPNCKITFEEAHEFYSKSLEEKSLNACKEVVDSVSGLSLSSIANKVGEGVSATTDIISVLTFSGLALIQPRVAKSWGIKTRKLVFTGLRVSIFSLFWIQACGITTISLTMLVIALLTGTILPIILSKVAGDNIKTKVNNYWNSKQLSAR